MKENYDDELERIKKYIEERRANNYGMPETNSGNNPLYTKENTEILSRISRKHGNVEDEVEVEESNEDDYDVDSSRNKIDDLEDLYEKEMKSKNSDKRAKKEEYRPYKKHNIMFTICMMAFFMFMTFYVISTHSTLLIRDPLGTISLGIGLVSFIGIIISIILKIRHRDLSHSNRKFNRKLTVMVIIVSVTLLSLIPVLNILRFWEYMDFVIAHKKKTALAILCVLAIIFIIFIIRVIMRKRFKDNTRRVFLSLFLICYSCGFIGMLFTFYGPLEGFKEWLITTAMPTMEHQKYCKWFYSEKEIKKVMSKNYIEESGESTKKDLIDKKKVTKYKDEYERQILEHEPGEKYKIIKIEVDGQQGFLAAIYDPTSIIVEVTQQLGSKGEYVTHMAQRNDALLAMNGGGFYDPGGSSWGGTPTGITISKGKVITNNEYGIATDSGGVVGFTEDGTLMLLKVNTAQAALKQGVVNAVSWGPFLIVNGVMSKVNGNGGWGPGARSAIGQRRDGVVLMLVIDSNASRTKGATMADLAEIMNRYGAVNAANLDGGTSSVMALPKSIARSTWNAPCRDYFTNTHCAINDPIDSTGTHQTRFVATSFVVLDK